MGYLAYYFQVYRWPLRLLKDLTSPIHNFLWSGSVDKKKLVVIAWADCRKPQSDSGLGLHDLRMSNEALLKKLAWSFINEDSFVFKVLRDRFLKDLFSHNQWQRSSVGFVLCSHLNFILSESIWVVGSHSKVLLWKDNWHRTPLIDLVQDVDCSDPLVDAVIRDFTSLNGSSLLTSFTLAFPSLSMEINKSNLA